MIFSKFVVAFSVVPERDTEVPVQTLFGKLSILASFPPVHCCFKNKPPLMKGHSEPGRASGFSPLLRSPPPSPFSLPTFLLVGTKQQQTKLGKNRGGLSPFVKSFERVLLKEDSKVRGGFLCLSFSRSLGRSLCTQSGETGVVIFAQKPFISGYHQENLANCLSCL